MPLAKTLSVIVFLLSLSISPLLKSQPVGIKFFEGNWAKLLEKAKEERKYIFIEMYGNHCLYCTHMDTAVFTSPQVFPLYNQRFVSFKINYSEGDFAYYDMAASYSVDLTGKYLPILLYFDTEGNVLRKETGGKTTTEMIDIAQEVLLRPKGRGIIAKPIEIKPEESIVQNEPQTNRATSPPHQPKIEEQVISKPQPPAENIKVLTPTQKVTQSNKTNATPQINTNTDLRSSSSFTVPIPPELKADYDRLNELSVHFKRDTTQFAGTVREYAYLLLKLQQPYNQVVNHYLELEKDRLDSPINRDFVYDFALNLENKAIDYFVKNIQYYKSIKGGERVNEKTKNAIEYTVFTAIKEKDRKLFSKVEQTIQKTYLPQKDQILFEMRSLFYQGIEDWNAYAKTVVQYMDKFSISDPKLLNDIAGKFHRNVNDKKMLFKALEWIELSVNIEHEYYNNFTHSLLLYRLGFTEKAIQAAQNAIYINNLRQDGTDATQCRQFLDRLNGIR